MGWAGGHIGAVWAVFIQVRVAAGGHICPQQGRGKHAQRRRDRASRRNEGAHGPLGVAVPSQAPQLACLLPTAHSESHLASVWLKPAALAIRQSGRSGLLCGVVGEPHKRQARERARSRCNDHGARRMRGKRAVSKAGLCRRQQAGRMGQRRTSKAHEATKSTRPAVPKGPVCMCVQVRADVREAGTSQVPWVRWETGHKSQGASCLPCWVGRTDDPTAATGRRAHESARPDGGFQAGAMNCAPSLTTGRGEGA